MKEQPLISVIVPVYGTEKYLKKCLDSILGQTYKNIELIIVNDGTKDNSENIIKKYLQIHENIKYVRHSKNRGLFRARVSGAEEAEGEYLAFVDSDDYISADFYRMLLKKAMSGGSDVVVSNTVFEDADGSQSVRQLYNLCFGKEELEGEEIRRGFFLQEGYCFSWHTVWNKLYSKKLWDKCFEWYKKLEGHLVMTEDIAFSSLLLYNAKKLTCEYSASYFYCKHRNASTDAENIKFPKFEKNMRDLKLSFDFVESYLDSQHADDCIRKGFLEFRKKYSRMYRTQQQDKFAGVPGAKKAVDDFLPGYHKRQRQNEFCFDAANADFSQGLDFAKETIRDPKIKYVSFDVFDTLILRQVYHPADLFLFLNYEFDRRTSGKHNISFQKIREISERKTREAFRNKREEITIKEIYDTMSRVFSLDPDIVDKMHELEEEYEYRFCRARKTGRELYDFAREAGKKIIIISDMYLEYDTVSGILRKNGFDGWEALFLSSKEHCLKYSGMLFRRALKEVNCHPQNMLHIGDTWNADVSAARTLGINTFFLPKARDSFENAIKDIRTNECAWMDRYMAGPFYDGVSARKTLGYRLMLSTVVNKFFDNPFQSFNKKSDFNCNPYFIGYYAVGMHCIGLAKWMHETAREKKYPCIYFLARDGYLPMKVFELYNSACTDKIRCAYLHASRKLTLPFMIKDKNDLYDLPIERNNHTPLSVCRLLSFCLRNDGHDFEAGLLENGFAPDKTFQNESELYGFMDFIAANWFDKDRLERKKAGLAKYYSQIEDHSVLFDMGYSGRIQSAICRAAGKKLDAFYIHTDNNRCSYEKQRGAFQVHSFYSGVPASTGIMREYMLSSLDPACAEIGCTDDGDYHFSYEKPDVSYPEKFAVQMLQKGAMDFAADFIDRYGDFLSEIDFIPQEASYPFEYLLRFCKYEDRKLFGMCNFEDRLYGNIVSVRADELFHNQLCEIETYQLPSDFYDLEKRELTVHFEEDCAEEEGDEAEEVFGTAGENGQEAAAMFLDVIEEDDSRRDKLLKCGGNTSNIVLWQSLRDMVNPDIIDNWYQTHPGGFDENGYDVFLTTCLDRIEENSDLTFVDAVLSRIGDKTLLPVGIGFSCRTEKAEFALGAESIKTLQAVAERCKSVGAAGEYSAEILSGFGIKNVRVIGTPSVYTETEKLTRIESGKTEIHTVAASFRPFYGGLTEKETQLLEYFAENNFRFIGTTDLELEDSGVNDDALSARLCDYAKKKQIYFTVPEWKKHIKNADFAFGMALQNNIMALHEKIPALFLCYETSDREICRFLDLPYLNMEDFDPQKSVYDYYGMADYGDFKSGLRRKKSAYIDFLKENGVSLPQVKSRVIEK